MKKLTAILAMILIFTSCQKETQLTSTNSDVSTSEAFTFLTVPQFGVRVDYTISGKVSSASLYVTPVNGNVTEYVATIPKGNIFVYADRFKYFYRIKKTDGTVVVTAEKNY